MIKVWICGMTFAMGAWLCAPATQAARPDDLFFDAAALALNADLARSQADWAKAHAQYTNALAILDQLRSDHPDWNPEVVDYRIRTYRKQLDNLDALLEPASALDRPPEPAPPEISPALREQILAAEADLAAAAQARQKLEAELQRARDETARLAAAKTALQAQQEIADLRTTFMELGASLGQ